MKTYRIILDFNSSYTTILFDTHLRHKDHKL